MILETWRPVLGAEEFYEVSDIGRVRSLPREVPHWRGGTVTRRGRIMQATIRRRDKRRVVGIRIPGDYRQREVAQLVCEAFNGARTGPHVRHLDGDQLNNLATNLTWGTVSENMLDRVRHGTHHEVNRTHCPSGHEYTLTNTYRWARQPNQRKCRRCRSERSKAAR